MLVGVHPFDIQGIASDQEIEDRIQSNPMPPMTPQLTSHLSPSAKDFIKSLMMPDPDERLTALAALRHSWIRGERTPTEKILGSDCKLAMYQDLRQKLATGIFAALVDGGIKAQPHNDASETLSMTHILKRAFEVFDEQGKGYVNEADLSRVITKVTGASLSSKDQKNMISLAKKQSSREPSGLSLSDFSQLFSRLGHEHFPRGSYIYEAGQYGDAMYFINSGKV
jgi:serine/threonine protein kinase